ncbi:hypothetical protein DFH29DRAFT_338368 [Suillus ampliporus]|nr:hypothetical protein DFH29DRAFT_338368 [Suillus ampliporus]
MTYFTTGNAGGQMNPVSEGFLPVVVCPDPISTLFNPYRFGMALVTFLGVLRVMSFQKCLCRACTINVTYNGGIISIDPIGTSAGSTASPNLPLSQYIATVMNYQAVSNQGLTNNPIGDFLTAYGTSNVTYMYSVLEDYWRGITEFASTQLRSGYSATGDIPSNMTRPTSGTMYVTTYGWRSQSRTYILVLVVITMIWGTTVFAAGYSIIQERHNPSDPSFDFSNPIHLVIAASWWGTRKDSFVNLDISQAGNSEDIMVRFVDVANKEGRGTSRKLGQCVILSSVFGAPAIDCGPLNCLEFASLDLLYLIVTL